MAETQTFKNHARFFPLFHFIVAPILLINFVNAGRHLYLEPNRSTAWGLVVAFALVGLALASRLMALKVQDRVIRLEMRLRMQQVLTADLCARAQALTPEQLVALRFASDAELAGLVNQVLGGELKSQKEIKQKVQNWTGDYLRA
jgi:hypothetical protein